MAPKMILHLICFLREKNPFIRNLFQAMMQHYLYIPYMPLYRSHSYIRRTFKIGNKNWEKALITCIRCNPNIGKKSTLRLHYNAVHYNKVHYNAVLYNADSIITRSYITRSIITQSYITRTPLQRSLL